MSSIETPDADAATPRTPGYREYDPSAGRELLTGRSYFPLEADEGRAGLEAEVVPQASAEVPVNRERPHSVP